MGSCCGWKGGGRKEEIAEGDFPTCRLAASGKQLSFLQWLIQWNFSGPVVMATPPRWTSSSESSES